MHHKRGRGLIWWQRKAITHASGFSTDAKPQGQGIAAGNIRGQFSARRVTQQYWIPICPCAHGQNHNVALQIATKAHHATAWQGLSTQ
jgi:hypothetical protein